MPDELRAILQRWANQNSGSFMVDGLVCMSELLQQAFADLQAEFHKRTLAPFKRLAADGSMQVLPMGEVLHWRKRPGAARQILLFGHYDTVFPADHPFQQARTLDEDTLSGPGVADMKGGLLILWQALRRFEQEPHSQSLGWEIVLVPDEEIGSAASHPFMRARAQDKLLAIGFEPALDERGTLAGARPASGNYQCLLQGTAAHVGRHFAQGCSAVVLAAQFIAYIQELMRATPDLTINVGTIAGGTGLNATPDKCLLGVNIRAPKLRFLQDATQAIGQWLEAHARSDVSGYTWHALSERPDKALTPKIKAWHNWCTERAQTLGLSLGYQATGGVCDGNYLAAHVPVIDTLGAIGGGIHTDQEYASLTGLKSRIELLHRLFNDLAAGKSPD